MFRHCTHMRRLAITGLLVLLASAVPGPSLASPASSSAVPTPAMQYNFKGNLTDSLNGSQLTLVPNCTTTLVNNKQPCNTTSTTAADHWAWTSQSTRGGGFYVLTNQPISTSYTMALKFSFSEVANGGAVTNGYRKIVDYANQANDDGFYFKYGRLQFFPGGSEGAQVFARNEIVDLVAVRDASVSPPIFSVYAVGADRQLNKMFQYADTKGGSMPATVGGRSKFGFFYDDNATNTEATPSGKVYRMQAWNKALTEKELAQAVLQPPPVNVTATPTPESGGTMDLVVEWEASTDSPPAEKYVVTVDGKTCEAQASASPLTCTITGLTITKEPLIASVVAIGDNGTSKPALSAPVVLTPPTITTTQVARGSVGVAYTAPVLSEGGTPPLATTWAYVSPGTELPPGLDLDADTGAISGTPTKAGDFPVSVTVIDAFGRTASKAYVIRVADPLYAITNSSLDTATRGLEYSQQLVTVGGPGDANVWSIDSGALPQGLTLDTDSGEITGTVTASPGLYQFTVKAVSGSSTTTKALNIQVVAAPPVTITTSTVPSGTENEAYLQSLNVTGGSAQASFAWSWAADAGSSLPAGLAIDPATGAISGTPTTAGSYEVLVTAKDTSLASGTPGSTDTRKFTLVVREPVSITTSSLTDAITSSSYSEKLQATGGKSPFEWQVVGNRLPDGLSLASDGTLSGTPTATGTLSFVVSATDSEGRIATRELTLTVVDPLAITTTSIPMGTKYKPYSTVLAAAGGELAYSWSVTGAADGLPTGMTLSSRGILSGNPTEAGTYTIEVQVTDKSGRKGRQRLDLVIQDPLVIDTSALDVVTQGLPFNYSITHSGGDGTAVSWTISSGSLPTGLILDPVTGEISGTTTDPQATYTFDVTISDGTFTTTKTLNLGIVEPPDVLLVTDAIADGTQGVQYVQQLGVTGGSPTPDYEWAVESGFELPAGLTINSGTGLIDGTPTTPGTYPVRISVTDKNLAIGTSGRTSTVDYTLKIYAPVEITDAELAVGTVGQTYSSSSLQATGGNGTYTWALVNQTLPPGLSLASDGTLSGTPSASGTYSFTVSATDADGRIDLHDFTLVVEEPLEITSTALSQGVVGQTYSLALEATGGALPYDWSWSATAGLPPGLSISPGGVVSGLPSAAGTYKIDVTVTDGRTRTETVQLTLVVLDPVSITTSSLGSATQGLDYSATLAATGGAGTTTWQLTGGALPQGLSLDTATGEISGTVTADAGIYEFTVEASDGTLTDSKTLLIAVALPTPVKITTANLPSGTTDDPYLLLLQVTGGSDDAAHQWAWQADTGSTLPDGLSLDPATGAITGTPTTQGTYEVLVTATDPALADGTTGRSDTRKFTIAVYAPVEIEPENFPALAIGGAFETTLKAQGGKGPYTWEAIGAGLPEGMNLSADGTLSGAPSTPGTYDIEVLVTDADGRTAVQQYSVRAVEPLAITSDELPEGFPGVFYSVPLDATGGVDPYVWRIAKGDLPDGLELDETTGAIIGQPERQGTFTFTVEVEDSEGNVTEREFTITIGSDAVEVLPRTLSNGVVGKPYVHLITASGGNNEFAWEIASGELPPGLSLTDLVSDVTASEVRGRPTTPGTYTFTVRAIDRTGLSTTHTYTVTIAAAPKIAPSKLRINGKAGTRVKPSDRFVAEGFDSPPTYAVSGKLPAGLTIDPSTGVISGKPKDRSPKRTYTVTATSGDQSATAEVTIEIKRAAPTPLKPQGLMTPVNLPAKLAASGCTRLAKEPLMTNAGQRARLTVRAQPLGRALADRGDFRYVRVKRSTNGWVYACVNATTALRVEVRLSAPATRGYTAYRESRVYRTR